MRVHLLCPGRLDQRTGGYLYDARMVVELRALGADVVVHEVGAAPVGLPVGEVVLADGLLWTDLVRFGRVPANPVVALVHSPLFREPGADPGLRALERAALQRADAVVVTSPWSARDLEIDAVFVPPGTDPAPRSDGDPHELLCVATLTPRKGHLDLLEALARIDGPWRLRCAGAPRDPAHALRIEEAVARLGLRDRVALLGDLDRPALEDAYRRAGVLVHAATWEAWGMALAEGLARGLCVVSTPAGVLDAVPAQAALRVPVGPDGLAWGVRRVLTDGATRARLRGAQVSLPTWSDGARRLLAVLREVA